MFFCLMQIVGIAAKQGQVRNAANTVVKVKQVLGRRYHVSYLLFYSHMQLDFLCLMIKLGILISALLPCCYFICTVSVL